LGQALQPNLRLLGITLQKNLILLNLNIFWNAKNNWPAASRRHVTSFYEEEFERAPTLQTWFSLTSPSNKTKSPPTLQHGLCITTLAWSSPVLISKAPCKIQAKIASCGVLPLPALKTRQEDVLSFNRKYGWLSYHPISPIKPYPKWARKSNKTTLGISQTSSPLWPIFTWFNCCSQFPRVIPSLKLSTFSKKRSLDFFWSKNRQTTPVKTGGIRFVAATGVFVN